MTKKYLSKKTATLIANGEFPNHINSINILNNSKLIICCDGAADSLRNLEKIPDIIIGDLDSLKNNFDESEIIHIQDQNDNDLRKALNWISDNMNIESLDILGATGLREDHTIGNIATFLYTKYDFEIQISTNFGIFHIINNYKNIKTYIGQCVSLFSINKNQKITTTGLKYELNNQSINLYLGTLNIAQNTQIKIQTDSNTPLLAYLAYKNE